VYEKVADQDLERPAIISDYYERSLATQNLDVASGFIEAVTNF
jgi:hypothetical protein